MDKPEIKVGDTYYVFDENHRVYKERKPGERFSSGPPIYRKYFVPVTIKGETSRSWILGRYDQKVPKKDPWKKLRTEKMVDDAVWINSNAIDISDLVKRCKDADKLRRIAEIVGFEEK